MLAIRSELNMLRLTKIYDKMAHKVFIWISMLPNDYGTCYGYPL